MDTLDRHLLTLAMLRGDRTARLVLGDLLEEQGDLVLANFARRARMCGDADLDLALRMLDSRQVVAIGSEFVGRYATDGLAVLVARLRHASLNGDSAGELNRLHHRLLQHRDGRFLWPTERLFRDACESLATAASCLARLVKMGWDDEPGSQGDLRQECVMSVSVAARQLRESRGGGRRELAWQIQCVSRMLQPLVAAR